MRKDQENEIHFFIRRIVDYKEITVGIDFFYKESNKWNR